MAPRAGRPVWTSGFCGPLRKNLGSTPELFLERKPGPGAYSSFCHFHYAVCIAFINGLAKGYFACHYSQGNKVHFHVHKLHIPCKDREKLQGVAS